MYTETNLTHTFAIVVLLAISSASDARSDRWVRYWGQSTTSESYCVPNGGRVTASELLAVNMAGEVLTIDTGGFGTAQHGTRRGWGSNGTGVYSWPPSSWSGSSDEPFRDFPDPAVTQYLYHTDVSLGQGHAAVIADGLVGGWYVARTVVCWGLNDVGQSDVPRDPSGFPQYQIVQVSCGSNHTLALRSNGQVRAWGANSHGQSNVPPTLADGLPGVVQVAGGGLHSMALHSNGQVTCWGAGSSEDPVDNFIRCGQSVPPVSLNSVSSVAAGGLHSVALKTDGSVVCWGAGSMEPTYNFNARQSRVPSDLGVCTRVSASFYATAALQADGVVRAWGWHQAFGQCSTQCDAPAIFGAVSAVHSTFSGLIVISDEMRPVCQADIQPSCAVDGADLGVVLASWGQCAFSSCVGDLNGDGFVEGKDLAIVLSAWGPCQP